MANKPDCLCWKDPQQAAAREQQIDGMSHAMQISMDQIVRDLNICTEAASYVGGAVMASVIFWVAYNKRGDGTVPTGDQIAVCEAEVMAHSRARLEGARMRDLDRAESPTDAVH